MSSYGNSGPEIVFFGLLALAVVVGLLVMVLWVWMLIDALTNEPSTGSDKIVWVLVIVFLGWLGALLYYIVRRPARIRDYGR